MNDHQEVISRYTIDTELGRGGQARVLLAHDPTFDRQVAIKVMLGLLKKGDVERFEREAKVIAQLEHSAIVPVYDYGIHEGHPFLVMRKMSGGDLGTYLSHGPLDLRLTHLVMQRICSALQKAHDNNVVHRDLKPANFLFDDGQMPYLADFGLARMVAGTQTKTIAGTPKYMAPEQIRGQNLGPATDVYQMTAILFEMLTGRPPFDAPDMFSLMDLHRKAPVPFLQEARRDLPAEWLKFNDIVQRGMSKEPTERYQTAVGLYQAFVNVYRSIVGESDPSILNQEGDLNNLTRVIPSTPPTSSTAMDRPPSVPSVREVTPAPSQLQVEQAPSSGNVAQESVSFLGTAEDSRSLPGWAWAAGGGTAVLAVALILWGLFPFADVNLDDVELTNSMPTLVVATATLDSENLPTPEQQAVILPTQTPTEVPSPTLTVEPTLTPSPTAVPQLTNVLPVDPASDRVNALRVRQGEILVDGSPQDWPVFDYVESQYLVYSDSDWDQTEDLGGFWKLAWDEVGLYVLAQIEDDTHVQVNTGRDAFKGDSIEIQLDLDLEGDRGTTSWSVDDLVILLSPGDFISVLPSHHVVKGTPGGSFLDVEGASIALAAAESPQGYIIEALIPWAELGLAPTQYLVMGASLNVNDTDSPDESVQELLYANVASRQFSNPMSWGTLTLADINGNLGNAVPDAVLVGEAADASVENSVEAVTAEGGIDNSQVSCAFSPDERWASGTYPAYAADLGCATSGLGFPEAAYQRFSAGIMVWRGDLNVVYVLYDTNRYDVFSADSAPKDYYASDVLKGAIGYLYNTNSAVSTNIGTPQGTESGADNFAVQDFATGVIFYFDNDIRSDFALMKNSVWQMR